MTDRQRAVLTTLVSCMQQRFEDNQWREKLEYPSVHELAARAMGCVVQAYRHTLVGSDADAMKHAADAANLIGLMVVCPDGVLRPTE